MTQCERLLNHLKAEPINPLQAWVELGIYRLGARIYDLKHQGHEIDKKMIDVTNKYGESYKVAQYTLRKAND